jgi:propanol-preferring alcohol dehydrogenase
MRALLFDGAGKPLRAAELPTPAPGPGQVRLRVAACGVCRTDLHVLDGELRAPKLPLVLGHEIVGRIDAVGEGVEELQPGRRVGVPWLGRACGTCDFCGGGQENLCPTAAFHGYTLDGGYAEAVVADARYVFPLPDGYDDVQAAPLLCAGLIGFRSYQMAGAARRLGLYGFGGAAHLLAQLATAEGREVYAFVRRGDEAAQRFARELGAVWAGPSDEPPPVPLDAAILFAPVGALVPAALRAVRPGGVVVCGGIHMSDIPSFPYAALWGERVVRSVANLTREDGRRFFELAARVRLRTEVQPYPLADAPRALDDLRAGRVRGAAVLVLG